MAATLAPVADALSDWLTRTTWQSAVLVLILLVLHLTVGRWLAPRWRYALWLIVVARLLMPATPGTPWSIFNFDPQCLAAIAPAAGKFERVGSSSPGESVTIVQYGVIAQGSPAPRPQLKPVQVGTTLGWRQPLVAIWLAGVIVVLTHVCVATAKLHRRLRFALTVDADLAELLEQCRREMSLKSAPRLLLTDAVPGPALFGLVRPQLLLPPQLLVELARDELRFVLLHELAHYRRRDALANLALVLAEAVHWFNPVARWALSRCRTEREQACDALVMSAGASAGSHSNSDAYGRAVLRVAEAFSTRRVPVAAVGMIHTRSQLQRRIAMIAAYRPAAQRSVFSTYAPVLLVLCLASCALTDERSSGSRQDATAATDLANAAADPESNPRALEAEDDVVIPEPNAELKAALEMRVPELMCDNTPLSDVIQVLRDRSGANIFVNWRALEAAGVERNIPISMRVRNTTLSKALQLLLEEAGGDTVRLAYVADDDVITVSTNEDLNSNTLTRVYDVRDIVIEIPNFTDFPNLGEPQRTEPRPAAPAAQTRLRGIERTREELIKQVVTLIQDTVDPDSWRDNGGTVGSIRELQGCLIVTQTPENHRQVRNLLEQLRETRAIQVTVEARFISLDLNQLPEKMRQKLAPVFKSGERAATFLTDDEVRQLLIETQKSVNSTVITAPRITLFNGQRAYVLVSTQRAYVSGFRALKTEDGGATQYEPELSTVDSGVLLDASATTSADRNYVTLTLRPRVSRLDSLQTLPYQAPAGAPEDLQVQVPHVTVQNLQTTVSVPDRETLLLGGFTETSDAAAGGEPTTRPVANLYMLVKPTIIVQRETPTQQFPLLNN